MKKWVFIIALILILAIIFSSQIGKNKMKLDVPFYEQTSSLNCGPNALKMALEFLGKSYSIEEIENAAEIKQGKAVSTIRLAIAAKKFGFKTQFFSEVVGFNEKNLELDFYKQYADLTLENETQELFNKAEELGIELNEKTLTLEEIIENIKRDRIIILLLDWNTLIDKKGYQGHFVVITGFDKESIYIHNSEAFFKVEKASFDKARKAKGTDQDLIIISKNL